MIGFLKDVGTVDPVVISSCIFMKDERSESQADERIEKVSTFVKHD
jgi:hypothetical protein